MAEFSRKSRSKRILENINTAQASKREVYDFYQRWRKQYGVKGKGLDFAKARKADIVRELHELETRQSAEIKIAPVKSFERAYEKVKKQHQEPGTETLEALKKLQKRAERLAAAGKISKEKAKIIEMTAEQPKPRKRSSSSSGRRQQRKNLYYKGRYAHDYIKKMCDDGLIDTEDFEDSQEIWYTIDLINNNSEDYDFFKEHYAGDYKEGSRDYYLGTGGFEDFLRACDLFERELAANQKPVPQKHTQEYWDALAAWLDSKGGITQI